MDNRVEWQEVVALFDDIEGDSLKAVMESLLGQLEGDNAVIAAMVPKLVLADIILGLRYVDVFKINFSEGIECMY
jgi:hypothetical protein